MSVPAMHGEPGPLFNVSAPPRFLFHSGVIGWHGAFFTELLTARSGTVDHSHAMYCVQRTYDPFRVRRNSRDAWVSVPIGGSIWQPGDEQRGEWRGSARTQFLFLSTARVEQVLDQPLPKNHAALSRRPETAPVLLRLLDAMSADLAHGSPAGPLVGDCLLTALCLTLFGPSHEGAKPGGLSSAARKRVLDRIEHDLELPLTLAELASEAGLGVRQFSRAFRKSTGASPYQYVLARRVERAQQLIAAGQELAEVALQCGFGDQSHLTRLFKRQLGMSPAAYRRTLER